MVARSAVSFLVFLALATSACTATQVRQFAEAMNSAVAKQYLDRALAFLIAEYANDKESVMALREPDGYGDIVGRWFTKATVVDRGDGTLSISFAGPGYRGHPEASNVMFTATSTCMYKPDIQIDSEYAYVTFTPVAEPTLLFEVHRITVMAEWGNTPEHRQTAAEKGAEQFLAKLRQGFTVAMNRNLETETWLGIGPRAIVPTRPYWATPGEQQVANDKFRVHEDGIDLVGPIHLEPGSTLRVDVRTNAYWRMDAYLVDDANARAVLANHVDRERNPLSGWFYLHAKENTDSWVQTFTANSKTVLWLIVDNRDFGVAGPPTDGVDNVVFGTIYVGVTNPR